MKWTEGQLNPEVRIVKLYLNNLRLVVAKKTRASLGNPTNVDEDGLLMDVDVQPVHEDDAPTREDKRRDVDFFFNSAVVKIVNGHAKKYCSCKYCPWVSSLCFVFGS